MGFLLDQPQLSVPDFDDQLGVKERLSFQVDEPDFQGQQIVDRVSAQSHFSLVDPGGIPVKTATTDLVRVDPSNIPTITQQEADALKVTLKKIRDHMRTLLVAGKHY